MQAHNLLQNKTQQHATTTLSVGEFSSVYAQNLHGNDFEKASLAETRLGHTRGGGGGSKIPIEIPQAVSTKSLK